MPRDTDVVVMGLCLDGASVVRHLAAEGLSVCGISHDPTDIGFASRHGWKALCPNPAEDLDGWVDFLNRAARDCTKRPALLPTGDVWVLALDKVADRLRDRFRMHGFGTGLRSALTSKRATFELAERHAFPMPKTRFAADRDELVDFARTVAGPVLLKPEFPPDWHGPEAAAALSGRKVVVADTPAELLALYDTVRRWSTNLVMQEVIPGPDANLIYWCGFMGPDHRVWGRLIGRKVRVLPVHYGSASFVELVDLPEVEQQCEDFLRALGYQGLCGIELKVDARDGVAKLIEVNPRYGLWDDIGIPVGVHIAHEAVVSLFGQTVAPHRVTRFDQKWVHLGRDLRAFRKYREEGVLGMADWLGSLRPPIIVNDLPWRSDFPYAWRNLRMLIEDAFDLAGAAKRVIGAGKARRAQAPS